MINHSGRWPGTRGMLPMLAALMLSCLPAQAQVPNPTVTGPIAAPDTPGDA
jgi:hypothetical protein